jgi:hypothetical protein
MALIHLAQNSTANKLNKIIQVAGIHLSHAMYSCFLIGYIKNIQLSNSSVNLVYIHFDQKTINYEPTKQKKNVDDRSCTGQASTCLTIAKSL